MCGFVVFFFKQKTAYEMRISDWSSDVCSSDLAAPATPAWVEKSNADAQVLIAAQAKFQPEGFSFFGIPGYDDKVADLGPDNGERFRAAMADAKATLEKKMQAEQDRKSKRLNYRQ